MSALHKEQRHISCVLVCVWMGENPCIFINSLMESHAVTCVIREKIEVPFQPSKCCSAMRSEEPKGVQFLFINWLNQCRRDRIAGTEKPTMCWGQSGSFYLLKKHNISRLLTSSQKIQAFGCWDICYLSASFSTCWGSPYTFFVLLVLASIPSLVDSLSKGKHQPCSHPV